MEIQCKEEKEKSKNLRKRNESLYNFSVYFLLRNVKRVFYYIRFHLIKKKINATS